MWQRAASAYRGVNGACGCGENWHGSETLAASGGGAGKAKAGENLWQPYRRQTARAAYLICCRHEMDDMARGARSHGVAWQLASPRGDGTVGEGLGQQNCGRHQQWRFSVIIIMKIISAFSFYSASAERKEAAETWNYSIKGR